MKKNTKIFNNQRVSASAGSGKTHSLTTRFIALTKHERNSENLPDATSIIALTFTRKSAGEFLRKILTRLADGLDETKAEKFKELAKSIYDLTKQELSQSEVENILMQSVKNIDKLKLSTIDAFFGSALKVFANEVGIFTPIQIVDFQAENEYKKSVVEFALSKMNFRDDEFKNFLEVLKSKNGFGEKPSSLNEDLQKGISNALNFKRNLSKNYSFGDTSIVKSSSLLEWDQGIYETEVEELEVLIAKYSDLQKPFNKLIKDLKASNDNALSLGGTVYDRIAEVILNNEVLSTIKYSRKEYDVPAEVFSKLSSILTRLHDAHIAKSFSAAAKMEEILFAYENAYFEKVVSKGMLTFGDVPELLNSNEKAKELLEFRLDTKFKHWLFDEFQDTSRTQWEFFSSIIDNIINPASGEKSEKTFYYVGDIKQSIYSWRGGDKELFKEIFAKYKDHQNNPITEAEPLSKSYRSSINIIRAVNEVFNKSELFKANFINTFKEEPSEEFLEIFEEHIAHKSDTADSSIAQLRTVNTMADGENFYKHILDVITQVKDSGKSIGILVSNNKQIQEITDYLTANNINVAPEGERNLAQNNIFVSGFIQLLKYIAHPEDTASFVYLKMTPFASVVSEVGFRESSLISLSTGKYVDFLKKIHKSEVLNNFDIDDLIEACSEFENSKKSGIDKLINFLQNKKIKLSSNSNFVQVMTIHKSKGLEFSIVILPHLESLTSTKISGLQLLKNKAKSTISYLPNGSIISLNKTLQNAKTRAENNAMFENICKLYVALTRAEDALYVILKNTQTTKPAFNTMLIDAFFRAKTQDVAQNDKGNLEIYTIGSENWIKNLKAKEDAKQAEKAKKEAEEALRKKSKKPEHKSSIDKIADLNFDDIEDYVESVSPSTVNNSDIKLDAQALAFGSAMHKVLEQIKYIESDVNLSIAKAISQAKIDVDLEGKIAKMLENLFAKEEVKSIFSYSDNVEIHNEFDFISQIDGEKVSGQIDRLMLEKDATGKVIFAKIIDYKGRYNPEQNTQLSLYKKAIQSSFKLDAPQVSTQVLSYTNASITDIK